MTSTPPTTVLLAIAYHDRLNGAQLGMLEIARSLPARGYRPILVSPGEGRATRAFRESGIEVRVLDTPAAFSRFNKAWLRGGLAWRARALAVGLPRLTLAVYRLIRSEDVALVHVNEPRALLLFGWGARLARRPLVLHARGSMRGIYPRLVWNLIQRLPHRIIRDGRAINADLDAKVRSKARVVYDAPYSRPARQASRRGSDDALTVVTVASFIPYKGYHHLLEAIPRINASVSEDRVRFHWFGQTLDEGYARQLRSRIAELDLHNVAVGGWTPDIDAVLRTAALYVQPTVEYEVIEIGGERRQIWSAEGIPHSILEALSFGVPAVASDVGSMREAVMDGVTGVLVPPGDPAALAEAIATLLRDPERRSELGREGKRLVERRFTLTACVAGVTSVYAELGLPPRI